MPSNVTPSLEDYLEAIYFLSREKEPVRVTDVSMHLGISKPSVNKAINVLKTREYVLHEHYGALKLTETGQDLAKNVANRHSVLKCFLRDILKVEECTAEAEACAIEHSVSAETIDKLSGFLRTVVSENKTFLRDAEKKQ